MPADNADLFVAASDPNIVLDSSDLEKFRQALFAYGAFDPALDPSVQMCRRLTFENRGGVQQGARLEVPENMIQGYAYTGAGPSGQPESPDYRSDAQNRFYNSFAYGLTTRGWIGGPALGFFPGMRVAWADEIVRAASDARGGWDGVAMALVDVFSGNAARSFSTLHGKASTDPNWIYSAVAIENVQDIGGPAVVTKAQTNWNGVQAGQVWAVLSGTWPGSVLAILQYWDGFSFQNLVITPNFDASLHFLALPPPLDGGVLNAGMLGRAFAGGTEIFGSGDIYTHWVNEVELSQFEPWVIDRMASRNVIPVPAGAVSGSAAGNIWINPWDLAHVPQNANFGSPVNLRENDLFWGASVELDENSLLSASSAWEQFEWEDSLSNSRARLRIDGDWDGSDSPLTVAIRVKMRDLLYFQGLAPADRYCMIWALGTQYVPGDPGGGSGVDEGIGFWFDADTEELVATMYSPTAGDWVEVRAPFSIGEFNDQRTELAVSWTGADGTDAGEPDYSLSIYVNGTQMAQTVISDGYVGAQSTAVLSVGFCRHQPTFPGRQGFRGLFSGLVMYEEAMTAEDIASAFSPDEIGAPFSNPSFEDAGEGPGNAAYWDWVSEQKVAAWAEFTAFVGRLSAPWESFEHLGSHARVISPGSEPYDFSVSKTLTLSIDDGVIQNVVIDPGAFTFQDPANATAEEAAAAITELLTGGSAVAWLGTHVSIVSDRDGEASLVQINIASTAAIELGFTADTASSQGVNDVGWYALLTEYADVVAAIFNSGEDLEESFEIWNGQPWKDAFTYVSAEWTSAIDYNEGWAQDWKLSADGFDEAWKVDPFYQGGGGDLQYVPGNALDGFLRSRPLTFPVVVPATRSKFSIYWVRSGGAPIVRKFMDMALTPGQYDTPADLVTELQSAWTTALAGETTFLEWGYTEIDGVIQLYLGWDQATGNGKRETVRLSSQRSDVSFEDVRQDLAFRGLGPGELDQDLKVPKAYAEDEQTIGPWDQDQPYYLFDAWSWFTVQVEEFTDVLLHVVPWGWDNALFDTSVGSGFKYDGFFLKGWTDDAAAEWKDNLGLYLTTQAEFDEVPPNDPPAPPGPGYRLHEDFYDDKWAEELY